MVKISKAERNWLVEHGVPCGQNGISKTYSHHTTYYLCESGSNMNKLNQYRSSVTITVN